MMGKVLELLRKAGQVKLGRRKGARLEKEVGDYSRVVIPSRELGRVR